MHRTLLCITFVLSYDFISAVDEDDRKQDHCLHAATQSIKESLLDPITKGFDDLNGKLQEINEEVKIQKATIEEMKGSLNAAEKGELQELLKAVENVSYEQIRNQKSLRESLKIQEAQAEEVKNVIFAGFSKVRQKLSTLSEVNTSLLEIYKETEKLATAYNQQETKLVNLHATLKNTMESVDQAITNNIKRLETMKEDVLKILDEQSKPLSNEALSHVSKLDAIMKTISSEMEKFFDLEPQLLYLYRLSEDLKKEIPMNNLVNNLTVSLGSLKSLAPSIIFAVSKDTKEVNTTLQYLKAMSKDNNCPVDFILEIHDHHNKIIKYLNDSIAERKNKQGNDEIWKKVMMKFDDILTESRTNGDISEELVKLREDINNIRGLLQEHYEETGDTVFG